MDYDPDELDFDDRYDDEVFFRTCGKCGARTAPRWSESACLEEARRYGWRTGGRLRPARGPANGPVWRLRRGSRIRASPGSMGVDGRLGRRRGLRPVRRGIRQRAGKPIRGSPG